VLVTTRMTLHAEAAFGGLNPCAVPSLTVMQSARRQNLCQVSRSLLQSLFSVLKGHPVGSGV
jgi:hypothetical protein